MLSQIKPVALGFLAGAAFSAVAAYQIMGWRVDSIMLGFQQEREELQNERDSKAAEARKLATENKRLIEKTATEVATEVIRYTPSDCRISSEWVRIHNRAVQTPGAASGSDGTPQEDASDRDVLAVVTDNYRVCQLELNRLKALQDWVEVQTE